MGQSDFLPSKSLIKSKQAVLYTIIGTLGTAVLNSPEVYELAQSFLGGTAFAIFSAVGLFLRTKSTNKINSII